MHHIWTCISVPRDAEHVIGNVTLDVLHANHFVPALRQESLQHAVQGGGVEEVARDLCAVSVARGGLYLDLPDQEIQQRVAAAA